MPIYEYQCDNGHKIEVFHGIDQPQIKKCTICKAKAHRIISSFNMSKNAGIHVFSKEHGGRDILHDKTMTNSERGQIISQMSRNMK
ncbi:MAG: zinc ribbon domain-containing protein [Thermodesulfobacteriota bacterium]|nr:zinc ribbon domain-containing protein [Thermodesulfobacteriota bacterium]